MNADNPLKFIRRSPQEMATRAARANPNRAAQNEVFTAPREIDLMEVVGSIWRGKLLIFACALFTSLLAGWYVFALATPGFTSQSRLMINTRDQRLVDVESVLSGISTDQTAINTELEIIRSRGLIERLVLDLKLREDPEFNTSLRAPSAISPGRFLRQFNLPGFDQLDGDPANQTQSIIDNVRDAILVSSKRDTFLIEIRATTNDPEKSAAIANRLAQLYLDNQIKSKFEATEFAVGWLSERVADLELDLNKTETEIKTLRANSDLVSTDALEALNIRVKSIRGRLLEAEESEASAIAAEQVISTVLHNADWVAAKTSVSDPILTGLIDKFLSDDETGDQELQSRLQLLLDDAKLKVSRAGLQRGALQQALLQSEADIQRQNDDLTRLNQLVREADATRVIYDTFLARLKETSVQIGLNRADSRILSTATIGEISSPQKARAMAVAGLFGALLGAAYLMLRQFAHKGVRTINDLEEITEIPVLGEVPRMPIGRRKSLSAFLQQNPISAAAEAIRNLRTSILMFNTVAVPKVIMVTSSEPAEGKTTLAIGLAHNLASLGKRILLIEGDLRKSGLQQHLGNPGQAGVMSVISGQSSLLDVVCRKENLGFDFLAGDHTNLVPADVFTSSGFGSLISMAREGYDHVVLDMPPVLAVPDARIAAGLVDFVLYCVRWDHTKRAHIAEGLRRFSSVGTDVSGLALTQIDPKRMKRYGYGDTYAAYAAYA